VVAVVGCEEKVIQDAADCCCDPWFSSGAKRLASAPVLFGAKRLIASVVLDQTGQFWLSRILRDFIGKSL
jgi:hypothetical protein